MKTTLLISLVTLSLIYATAQSDSSSLEYEHALKSASSEEGQAEDMSKMKAMGKCGADQKSHKPSSVIKEEKSDSPKSLEYEHALKSVSSEEGQAEDMSKMKAMGKCGADQKSHKPSSVIKEEKNDSPKSLEYEHALKSASSEEGQGEDMSKMKAMGKCGGDK